MTIIAAAMNEELVCIGSDSMGSDGHTMFDFGSKLIYKNDYIIGFSDSYRVADIIREGSDFPEEMVSIENLRDFRDTLKDALLKDGCSSKDEGGDTLTHPVGLILASSCGIFSIDSDYQIHEIDKYHATGSGYNFALGALYGTLTVVDDPELAVSNAVESAIEHCTTCGGLVYIEEIPRIN